MKLVITALAAINITAIPLTYAGEYQPGFSASRTCIRNEYREEYVPGTQESPGYVRSWTESVDFPCETNSSPNRTPINSANNEDNNDCSEGTLIGGLLGAGLATTGSRGRDRWWAIPAGAVGGAMVGCQIDGG